LKRRILLVGIAVLLIISLLIPMACVPKRDTGTTAPAANEELQALQNVVAAQAEAIADLQSANPDNLKPSVNQNTDDIGDVNDRIVAMQGRLDALEVVKEEEEEEATTVSEEDTVRWSFDAWLVSSVEIPIYIDIRISDRDPNRIEEEGLYEIELLIYNGGGTAWDMGSLEIELVLEPRSYCPVNEDDTYLDSDDSPWLDWDADFIMKTREGVEVCRRIEFTSDKHNFAKTLAPETGYTLDLVLELYYK